MAVVVDDDEDDPRPGSLSLESAVVAFVADDEEDARGQPLESR